MTYAKFGYLMRDNLLDLSNYGVLICDEMQSLMRYMDWDLARVKPVFSKFCKDEHFNLIRGYRICACLMLLLMES